MSIHLGNGGGTFQRHDGYDLGYCPWTLAVEDLDGDGHVDLVADTYDRVSILLGGGDGTFRIDRVYETGSYYETSGHSTFLVVSDLDGDGFADIAVANGSSDDVSVLPGIGDGTFAPAVRYCTIGLAGGGYWPTALVADDFDEDGLSDLAVSCSLSEDVSILLQTPCRDRDGDGHADGACGGTDCDDTDAEVHPGHPEVPGNGIDDDCDGEVDEGGCFIGAGFEG